MGCSGRVEVLGDAGATLVPPFMRWRHTVSRPPTGAPAPWPLPTRTRACWSRSPRRQLSKPNRILGAQNTRLTFTAGLSDGGFGMEVALVQRDYFDRMLLTC